MLEGLEVLKAVERATRFIGWRRDAGDQHIFKPWIRLDGTKQLYDLELYQSREDWPLVFAEIEKRGLWRPFVHKFDELHNKEKRGSDRDGWVLLAATPLQLLTALNAMLDEIEVQP